MEYTRVFPENEQAERALLILATFSPDMIEGVATLFSMRSPAQVREMVGRIASDGSGRASPNAVFSVQFMPTFDDFYYCLMGLNAIMLNTFKGLKMGNDDYQKILETAYALPSPIADELAKKIDSFDDFSDAARNAKAAWYQKIWPATKEYSRRVSNWGAGMLNLPYEIDQRQDYDIDFLYEIKSLGKVVEDLNGRLRLMGSQARLIASMSLSWAQRATGDIETGDPMAAAALAHQLHPVAGVGLPKMLYGGQRHIAELGNRQAFANAQALYNLRADQGAVGDMADEGDIFSDGAYGDTIPLGAAIQMIARREGPFRSVIEQILDNQQKQQNTQAIGDAVRYCVGDLAADAMESGDIETFMGELLDTAETDTSGDVAEDEQIMGDVAEESGPEVGGLFMKWRTKRKMRKAKRRKKRAMKKAQFNYAKSQADRDYGSEADEFVKNQHANDPENVYQADADAAAQEQEGYAGGADYSGGQPMYGQENLNFGDATVS